MLYLSFCVHILRNNLIKKGLCGILNERFVSAEPQTGLYFTENIKKNWKSARS